jgi:hypothetical protein
LRKVIIKFINEESQSELKRVDENESNVADEEPTNEVVGSAPVTPGTGLKWEKKHSKSKKRGKSKQHGKSSHLYILNKLALVSMHIGVSIHTNKQTYITLRNIRVATSSIIQSVTCMGTSLCVRRTPCSLTIYSNVSQD